MPLTFPAHQGLILPVMRRWPGYFDALASSVGAAMPDISDSVLGFMLNGYFKQWYGNALTSIFYERASKQRFSGCQKHGSWLADQTQPVEFLSSWRNR